MGARRVAFETLLKIKHDKTYSNQALTWAFSENELSVKDRGLVTEVVYGTLTHDTLLNFWLQPYFRGRVKEWVRTLLAMTLYQLVFLEKIPNYAAIDEAVEIAKVRGGDFNAKAVNAILRKISTSEKLRSVDELEEKHDQLAIQYSHPTWLVRLWIAQFGIDSTIEMLQANNRRAKLVLRTNLTKISRDALLKTLASEGVVCTEGTLCEAALIVNTGNPLLTDAFKEGLFYVQDEASMLPALALAPQKGAHVLDVCAAPGGKTFHLAELVGDLGTVYAHDIYDHKIARIRENAKRLGIYHVEATVCSALEIDKLYEPECFDYILVDAPCSGLGILRRHPEAKLSKQPGDLDAMIQIQKDVLFSASQLLKPGGRLVYSTCTVNKKENQRQIEGFLAARVGFELDDDFESRMPAILKENFENKMLQLLPQDFETDGFFIASVVKKTSDPSNMIEKRTFL